VATIIDGKAISKQIRDEIKAEAGEFAARHGVVPGLAVVIVGEDPSSQIYVRNKKRACEEVGFYSEIIEMPESTTMDELKDVVRKLNQNPKIHGVLVQSPLPRHLDEFEILLMIDPKKDVDAFSPYNTGRIMIGKYDFVPCTPAGVMELLARSGVTVEGKECVVVGRSNIVGKPMAQLLLAADGTVTICHSKTKNLGEICRRADIIVSAAGKPGIIKAGMVKPGAAVIDVGTTRMPDGKLAGDVEFDEVKNIASFITPVPGGVGPMTIAMLLKNTLTAAKKSIDIQ
jgi:methylenetetrahydrofolate dehydrogenase (NADP+)/methenyltetrahydrofolate cyclohydrolase